MVGILSLKKTDKKLRSSNELKKASSGKKEGMLIVGPHCDFRLLRDRGEKGGVITPEQKAEEIHENERKYRLLFEESRDAIYITSRDGKFIDVNRSWLELFGYTLEEVAILDAHQLYLSPEDRVKFQQEIESKGSVRDYEVRHRKKDGTEIVCLNSGTVRWGPDGSIQGYQGFIRDITERVWMEEALHKTRQFAEGLIRFSPLAITVLDTDFNIRSWNKSAERIFGWTETEVIGRSLPYVPQEKLSEARGLWERTLNGEVLKGIELQRFRKDGSQIEAALWTAPMRNRKGAVVAAMLMFDDITERKKMETMILHSQKLESLGHLAGGIAHDFNNIIAAIMGYSDLILLKMGERDSLRPKIEAIRAATQKGVQITRQLLAFSRRQLLQPRVVDMNARLRDMVEMTKQLIPSDIQLIMTPFVGDAQILIDPNYLDQVIMNLVVNARDAMPNGGKLFIEVNVIESGGNHHVLTIKMPAGEYVTLTVRDTGHGMTPEVRARIFEPFFTTKPAGKGTGLGLSTVFGIVKQSGGYIDLQSDPGKGTTFTIFFPLARGAAEEVEIPTNAEGLPRGVETVMVAEDEASLRKVTCDLLTSLGYKVLEAQNGDEALGLAQKNKEEIHLLFTDIVMPGTSGIDLAVRFGELYPATKILFATGHAEKSTFHFGLLDSSIQLLMKPYPLEALARKVRDILDGKPKGKELMATPSIPRT